jgi:two-component system chemotaxis response regulator CheB
MNNENKPAQIRILIVDDSAFMRTALSRMISVEAGFYVVGTAASGTEALSRIPDLDPDVITLDVEMAGLDGLETLRRIMSQFPRPVIMVSSITERDKELTLKALAAGAFDYVPKQLSSTSLDILHIREQLVTKIRAAAASRLPGEKSPLKKPSRAELPKGPGATPPTAIVALGVSTGGPKALQEILPLLPGDLPVPILVVQHMPAGFIAPFAERLNSLCAITVCQASQGAIVRPGVAYFAPAGSHMTVDRSIAARTVIRLSAKPESQLHVPSVDVLMQSVATEFRSQAMGIILTGMGLDGAQGMSAIHREGGFTLGQDEATSAVYGMPRACAEMGILDKVVPLSQIPHEILHATRYQKSSAAKAGAF